MIDNQIHHPPDVTLCADHYGRLIPVANDLLKTGIAAYGLLLEREKVLLQTDARTGLLHPPGGQLEESREPATALQHVFQAVTGITPAIGQLLLIDEAYRYQEQEGVHLISFFYRVDRPRGHVGRFIDFDGPAHPQWIKLDQCPRQAMLFGYHAVQIAATFPI